MTNKNNSGQLLADKKFDSTSSPREVWYPPQQEMTSNMAAPVNEKNIKIKALNRLNYLLSAHNINDIMFKMVDYAIQ